MYSWQGVHGTVYLMDDHVRLVVHDQNIVYPLEECTATSYGNKAGIKAIMAKIGVTAVAEINALLYERQHPPLLAEKAASTCSCLTTPPPNSIEEHGSIQIVVGPFVNQLEYCWVGRCTICGAAWTFIAAEGPGGTSFCCANRMQPTMVGQKQ